MRRALILLAICPLLAASALAQSLGNPLEAQLQQARREQAAAEAATEKLAKVALQAKGDADRLAAQQMAAAQGIEAAEARITAADAQLRLASADVAEHKRVLAQQQQPLSALLAGLALMGRRPPLVALADHGSTDELVKVRILLDATLPVIRSRTAQLSSQLVQAQRLEAAARDARVELARSRSNLVGKRQRFAALEQQALGRALASTGEALGTGDVALAAGETVERLNAEQASGQAARALAQQIAAEPAPPLRPFGGEGGTPAASLAYQLPSAAPVVEGLSAVNDSGVRSRGLTLATARGAPVMAPASGTVRFAGPFRDYDGVLIIDHGAGWVSLLVNVSPLLRSGERVGLGDLVGHALGPIQVELSHRGRRISPALIAGSSPSLSKVSKGG